MRYTNGNESNLQMNLCAVRSQLLLWRSKDEANVKSGITQRSFVCLVSRYSTARKVVVVRWPQDENPLHFRGVDVTIRIGCGRALFNVKLCESNISMHCSST